jgi:hypothetical protein
MANAALEMNADVPKSLYGAPSETNIRVICVYDDDEVDVIVDASKASMTLPFT